MDQIAAESANSAARASGPRKSVSACGGTRVDVARSPFSRVGFFLRGLRPQVPSLGWSTNRHQDTVTLVAAQKWTRLAPAKCAFARIAQRHSHAVFDWLPVSQLLHAA